MKSLHCEHKLALSAPEPACFQAGREIQQYSLTSGINFSLGSTFLSYLPYRKEPEKCTSVDTPLPTHAMHYIWKKKVSLLTANNQRYKTVSSSVMKRTSVSLDKQPLTQTFSFWHLLRRQNQTLLRDAQQKLGGWEGKTARGKSHWVLGRWNFTEKVHKTTTKQGDVRGTTLSALPLTFKVTFPNWQKLFFPQREARIIWQAEIPWSTSNIYV